jgi:hypothetical protein
MNKFLVTTTINPPTEAVRKLANMPGWTNVTVGDKKSPHPWHQDGVTYLGVTEQEVLPYETVKLLPFNLPARAMLGFLYAMEHGATLITQVDDDNIPYEHFDIPAFHGTHAHITEKGFVNIYKYFTDTFIWPRGYPLNRILETHLPAEHEGESTVGVWQHLADNDTDVDAIYRLTRGDVVTLKQREPIVLSEGAVCPFNCQSTTFEKSAFPLLYLPVYISPRESDIVRSLITQPILWRAGKTLGFTSPTVTQERNPHDYQKDFAAELLIYLHAEDIFKTADEVAKQDVSIEDNLRLVYAALVEKGFIPKEELALLEAWLADVARLTA